MTAKRPALKDFKKLSTARKGFNDAYDALKPEFAFINQLILARKKARLSQEDLAVMLHTKQPAIARLENGGFAKSSFYTIQEYAAVLGYDLKIRLIPRKQKKDQDNSTRSAK